MAIKKVFIVNEYISLKLEEGNTHIYINGEKFRQCAHLFIANPERFSEKKYITMDEIADHIDMVGEKELDPEDLDITPEEIFWGHCSNIQAWVEHEYDTRLIDRYLAFPILRKLAELKVPQANEILKNEIIKRFSINYPPTILFLLKNNLFSIFTREELEVLSVHFVERCEEGIFKPNDEIIWEIFFNFIKIQTNERILKSYIRKIIIENPEDLGYYLSDYLIFFDDLELNHLLEKSSFYDILKEKRSLRKYYEKVLFLHSKIGNFTTYKDLSEETKNGYKNNFLRSLLRVLFDNTYKYDEKQKKIKEIVKDKYYRIALERTFS